MELTVNQIAGEVSGKVFGDGDIRIVRPAKIEEAKTGEISFVANGKYEALAKDSKASALLVNADFDKNLVSNVALIQVENVYEALTVLLKKFDAITQQKPGISALASIHEGATIGADVSVSDYSVIGAGSQIGDNAIISTNCSIGNHVKIGANTKIFPGVRIYANCVIGANCILHSNAVIGADGFGFFPSSQAQYQKIPQIGNVVIEDNVEIGSNTVIDRGTMGSTTIRKGVKLDNLIQIAHNVEIGENTVIAAQCGIAGSAKIGKRCMIGGQVGIAGHLSIADGTMIQAQSGIASSIEEKDQKWYGFPAISYYKYLRSFSVFKILPNLLTRLEKLEEKLTTKND